MNLEALQALPVSAKSAARRATRRRMSHIRKLLLKPLSADKRAFLSGYLDTAHKALEALR